MREPGRVAAVTNAGARGVIAAMAMTGLRNVTTGLGLVTQTPPEEVLSEGAPQLLASVPKVRQKAAVEMLHWAYGAAGGAAYGVLPRRIRRQAWTGPAYGVLVWALFEAGIAPVLGLSRHHGITTRLAFLADHVLYGMVVGASPWPHRD